LNAADLNRGRDAAGPRHIRARGWWDVLVRVKDRLGRSNASLVSAGLAMYALLAIFPALTAAVFLYGLFGSPQQLITQLHAFAGTMPPGVWDLFQSQLREVASRQHGALSTAAAVSGVVAIWSARSGMASLITATNIAYGEREQRSLIRQVGLSLLFAVGALLSFIVLLVLSLAVPLALRLLGLSAWMQTAAAVLMWFFLSSFAVVLGAQINAESERQTQRDPTTSTQRE